MSALKSTLYTLLKASIGAETVIFADQNSPRPALPYWTMKVQLRRKIGHDAYSQGVTNAGEQTVFGVREGTVQIQRIGTDSGVKMSDLRDILAKTSVMEQWRVSKISLYDMGDVQNVPYPLDDTQLEPRASMDIFVRFGTSLLDTVGAIETLDITAGFDSKPNLTETFSVVL